MKTRLSSIAKPVSVLLSAVLFAAGCQPAYAAEVSVADTPPAIESCGPSGDADFVTANAGWNTAMLYVAPTVPRDAVLDPTPAGTASPLTLQIGTGRDTRLGVDVSAINAQAERDGWPWYAWAGAILGVAAIAGLAAWAIVEATNDGSHDQDSSTHITVVGDDGSTVNVRVGSDNNSSSSSTTTGW